MVSVSRDNGSLKPDTLAHFLQRQQCMGHMVIFGDEMIHQYLRPLRQHTSWLTVDSLHQGFECFELGRKWVRANIGAGRLHSVSDFTQRLGITGLHRGLQVIESLGCILEVRTDDFSQQTFAAPQIELAYRFEG